MGNRWGSTLVMPVETAALGARGGRRVAAAAIAVALQGVFYWLILHETVEPTALPASTPLEVTLFAATMRRVQPATLPRKRRQRVPPRRALRKREVLPPSSSVAQPITLPPTVKPAPHAPIDWQQAMQGEVRAQESRSRAKKLQFGFPQPPPADPAAPPELGWDYAHTHRIVPLPHGGMIINFSERCSINVWYPIPLCQFGKLPVNGHLFDHLHDPGSDRPGALP